MKKREVRVHSIIRFQNNLNKQTNKQTCKHSVKKFIFSNKNIIFSHIFKFFFFEHRPY